MRVATIFEVTGFASTEQSTSRLLLLLYFEGVLTNFIRVGVPVKAILQAVSLVVE